jgi:D-alanine-D-alanine ligase
MAKKNTLAFLYNIRHSYPDPNDIRGQWETDFDDPPTIKWMIKHLKKGVKKVIPIEANEKAYLQLYRYRKKVDLAFNYAEGIYGQDRECHLPAMLEMLQIPYTGSRPLTQALGLNKAKTKEILLAHQIPTLPFQVFKTGKEKLSPRLNFPLIVKPVAQGSSAGITNKSVVNEKKELAKQAAFVIQNFHQPALVEPFLSGREFSVAMLSNPPQILPLVESDHSVLPKNLLPLDSLEVKWYFEEESGGKNFICPAKINQNLENEIKSICLQVWQALQVTDLCRIDIRCNQKEKPYVLEINSPPGLIPPEVSTTSYFPLMAKEAGIDYDELLQIIIKEALKRYEKNLK